MKTYRTRILSWILTVALLCTMLPMGIVQVSASGRMTVQDLKNKFPHGAYWNHTGTANNPDGYTWSPCNHHGDSCVFSGACGCNSFFGLSIQCMGFAEKLGYDFTGYNPRLNANGWYTYSDSSSVDSVKPGDIVGFKNGSYDHYIFVTNVSGDIVTYGEGNSDHHCKIQWGSTITKTQLKANFRKLRSAPYAIENGESVTPSVTYSSIDQGVYFIKNNNTGDYLHVANDKDEDTTNIHLFDFGGYAGQQFSITAAADGYKMRPLCSSSRYVNPYADTVVSGKNVNLYHDTNESSQWWKFEAVSGGHMIHNVQNPSVVMDVLSGWDVYVNTRSGAASQVWTLQNRITYDANGGSGAPGAQMKDYGKALTLSSTVPTRGGYNFLGWSTNKNATSAEYAAGGSYTANASTTLYAVWKLADTEAPTISNVKVYNVTEEGYFVSCTVSDNIGVAKVSYPTWTDANGQDDMLWKDATIDGNVAYFEVKTADHNYESGLYTTHIYAYDANNNYTAYFDIWVDVTLIHIPRKTVTLNGHIYAFYDAYRSWNSAKGICEVLGGHLITINSQEEQDLIEANIDSRAYWIGASDVDSEGQWRWVTDEEWSYTRWKVNQPDNDGTGENYVHLCEDGSWNDIDNEPDPMMKIGFIIEYEPHSEPVSVAAYGDTEYLLFDTPMTWTEAKAFCENLGGHLAMVTSLEEQQVLYGLVQNGAANSYWLGASDVDEEGNWQWVTGEVWSYNNWEPSEPNNDNVFVGEDFLEIYKSTGLWNDLPNAKTARGFICERKVKLQGDVVKDGKINTYDALILYASTSGQVTLEAEQTAVADMNNDGVINTFDALLLYKQASGQ